MQIDVPAGLKKLAEFFPVPLYAVGGFVRDTLLGFRQYDIDISSPLSPDDVKSLLAGTEYIVKDGSKKLLTLIIKCGDEKYEYTTFRKDSYLCGHRPESVVKTDDIFEDASRRDFTVNAIYYDIKNGRLVDPLNGIGDLNNKLLRTTRKAEDVFSEDGLRLMRLARFSASLDFAIAPDALIAAKNNASLITEISPERIRDELDKILVCDTVYGKKGAQADGLECLREIGVLERILPEITAGIGMEQPPAYHKFDVYGHIIHAVRCSDPEVRLAALFHDVAKPYMKLTYGYYRGHDKQGAIMTKEIMQRLRYPTALTDRVSRLVGYHMFNLTDDAKENTIRKFILKNQDIVDDFIKLKYADYYGCGLSTSPVLPSAERIRNIYAKMKEENVPFSVGDLKVNGLDLECETLLPPDKRGLCLKSLLEECVLASSPYLTREKQLQYIQNYSRSKKWNTE